MSNMKRVMVRDEFGYISNQGKSKYWGVSYKTNSVGRDVWMVSVAGPKQYGPSETYFANFCSYPDERQMAAVAAAIYQKGGTSKMGAYLAVECPLNNAYILVLDRSARSIARYSKSSPLAQKFLDGIVYPQAPLTLTDVIGEESGQSYAQQVEASRKNIVNGIIEIIRSVPMTKEELDALHRITTVKKLI